MPASEHPSAPPGAPTTPARRAAALARARVRLAKAERDLACASPDDQLEAEALHAEAVAALEDAGGTPPDAAPATAVPAPLPAPGDYLTTREAAALLGLSVRGLEAMRKRGQGPPYKRIGRAVRYLRADLTK